MATARIEYDMTLDTVHDGRATFIEDARIWLTMSGRRHLPMDREITEYVSGHHTWEIPTWEWHFLGQPIHRTVSVAL